MTSVSKSKKPAAPPGILHRRSVSICLNALLFIINFLLFYFIWVVAFPDLTGFARLALCWVGAYAMTWVMSLMAKGAARLVLTLLFLGLLYIVSRYHP